MPLSRREMLVASVGTCLAGCGGPPPPLSSRRPGADWPTAVSRPSSASPWERQPARSTPPPSVPSPSPYASMGVIPRSRWTQSGPVGSRINSMGGIASVTLHHEGWTPVYFTDAQTTAERIELVRSIHVDKRGWGDLGYHFVIDRAGRVWEGRDVRFQGAHVKDHNEHNIGVMVLGNFEQQRPSSAQVEAMVGVVRTLARQYRISPHRVYTHQELRPTACPGRALQPRIASLRSAGYFA